MKNKIIGFILLMIFSSLFIACTKNKQEDTATSTGKWSGTVKVQMIGNFQLKDTTDPVSGIKQKGVNTLKDEFERRYPGATVEFLFMGWDSYQEKSQTMLLGNEADVYQVPGIASFAAQDLLEPLQPYVDRDNYDLDKYIDGQVDGWKAMNSTDTELNIYGMPIFGDTRNIYYDKQLFDEWGVEYLSEKPTIDELIEKSAQLTGINPVSGEQNYGMWLRGKYIFDLVINVAESLGGTWGSGFKWEDMQVNFDSPEMIQAMKKVKELVQYSPEGYISAQGAELFPSENNNVAIIGNVNPGTLMDIYSVGLQDRYGVSMLFVNPDLQKGGTFQGSPAAIGASSTNKDLAWEYIKFTGSDFYQEYMLTERGFTFVPVLKSSLEWDIVKATPHLDIVIRSMQRLWTPRYPYRSGQLRSILGVNVESVLLETATPEEGLKKAQEESDAWLATYKK